MKALIRIIVLAAFGLFAVTAKADTYTLTKDEDWTNRAQSFPETVDLNGHTLTVSRLSDPCTITDLSELGSGGELRVDSATNVTKTDATKIEGSLTLVKDGAGTLTWNGGTLAATIPILVTNGVFKLGVTTANVFGNSGTITVKGKGQFDINYGNGSASPVLNKKFEIEGDGPDGSGALVNFVGPSGKIGNHISSVTLTGDATIGGDAVIDFRGNNYGVYGPDYVLTVKNTKYIAFCGGQAYLRVKRVICDGGVIQPCSDVPNPFDQISEGVFLKNGGTLAPWSGKVDYELPFALTVEDGQTGYIRCDFRSSKITGDVSVGTGATLTLAEGQQCTFAGVVDNNGTISATVATTITGTLRGNGAITGSGFAFGVGTSCWHVECNDVGFTERVNLDNASGSFLASLNKINVVSSGSAAEKTYDLAPANGLTSVDGITLKVTDATSGMPLGASTLAIENNRLVLTVTRDSRPAVAHWTGAKGNGDLADAGNWACTNDSGVAVSALPCEITDVCLNGEIAFQVPAGTTFAAKSVTMNLTLTDDCDWSGLNAPVSGRIDLNGNSLTVPRLYADCEITDSSAAGSGGELCVNCADDVVKTAAMRLTGSFSLVKAGAGTFSWNGGDFKTVDQILVTNGVFKLGVTTADVFGSSGTIVVKGKGQFCLDTAGTATVVNKTFLVEGDGPDGSGAIVNDVADGVTNLKDLRLTGDATIGGLSRIDFRGNDRGVTGPDYTLTIKNTSMVAICAGNAFINVKRVVCSDGGVFQPCSNTSVPFNQIPDGVFLRNGGIFAPWSSNANYVFPLKTTVEAGETGVIRADYMHYKISGTITVEEGATLTLNKNDMTPGTFTDVVNNGTIAGEWPESITGTLSGNGAITATGLAFGGDNACWHVDIDGASVSKVNLVNASENFLANLKRIEVLADGSEPVKTYILGPRKGLASAVGVALSVTDATSELPLAASTFEINGDNQLVVTVDRRDPRPAIAAWTGKAGDGRLDNPENWACTNAAGNAVSELPCEITDVHLNGELAIQFPAGTTLAVQSIVANATLADDCDWSGLTAPVSGKIDLKGHNLTVTQLSGNGEITDSSEAGFGGELHVNCAADVAKTSTMTLTGSLTLVKDGEGTFTWSDGTIANTASVLVTNGVFKLGVTTLDLFGNSGTIVVKEKGQFDLNCGGTSPVLNKTFLIEGDGPDGSGAIVNTIVNGGGGWHLKDVRLTGDATIGGRSRIDFRGNDCGVTGPDYTLTIKNTEMVAICSGTAFINVKRVVCTDGGVFQPCTDTSVPFNQIPEGVFLRRGGIFAPWCNRANYEFPLAVTVEAGESGVIRAEHTQLYRITRAVTVEEGATLTLNRNNKMTCTFADVVNNGTITGDWPQPITGTLSGSGAITATGLVFGGDNSCWHVDIDGPSVSKVNLDNASASFITNLKRIEVSYVHASGYYDLAPTGLQSVDGIEFEAINAKTERELTSAGLKIRNGRLGASIPINGIIIIH